MPPKITVTDVCILLKNETCPFRIGKKCTLLLSVAVSPSVCKQNSVPVLMGYSLFVPLVQPLKILVVLCKCAVSVMEWAVFLQTWVRLEPLSQSRGLFRTGELLPGVSIPFLLEREGKGFAEWGISVWITNYNFVQNGRVVDAMKNWRGKCLELFENSWTSY